MLIVPISGDQIRTHEGLPFKVLSFTNYKAEGPAVLVEKQGDTDVVDFRDIEKIGKSRVTLLKNADGNKVFSADGVVHREYHLPQPGDTIKADPFGVGKSEFIVVKLSLGVRNRTTEGLILDIKGKDDGEPTQISLNQVTDIDQMIFNKSGFVQYYSDYVAKGAQ